jgi:hypothetical protein
MIREGLLDSQRYWSVTIEARELFTHLMLLADDFGCISLAPLFIRRRCFNDRPTDDMIDKLLDQLAAADLIRVYQAAGARYGFIPRFKQRLQRMTLKHPAPPLEMLRDDDDAQKKFEEVQAHRSKDNGSPTVTHRLPTVGQQPKRSEVEVEVELKGREKEVEVKKVNGAHQEVKSYRQRAAEIGLSQLPDEPEGTYQARVSQVLERQRNRP